MQNLLDGMLKKERDVADLRRLIRNWLDWALGERLESIKKALEEKSMAKATRRNSETNLSVSEPLICLPSPNITISESQDTVEASKKRRIDESSL